MHFFWRTLEIRDGKNRNDDCCQIIYVLQYNPIHVYSKVNITMFTVAYSSMYTYTGLYLSLLILFQNNFYFDNS